jgi:hypothetical protein
MNAKLIAAAGLIFSLASPVRAENARLPYAALYRMEQIQNDLSHAYTNLVVVLRMAPTNAAVKASDVVAYIDTKQGKIPIKIAANGEFTVPLREDLLAEETWLVTDQPKGAMQLDWGLALAVDRVANPTSYRRLMKSVKDCEYVEDRMREVLPATARVNITGLKITFSPSARNPSVTINVKAGPQKIIANAGRQLIIPMNPAWLDENPEVTFSAPPDRQELAGD